MVSAAHSSAGPEAVEHPRPRQQDRGGELLEPLAGLAQVVAAEMEQDQLHARQLRPALARLVGERGERVRGGRVLAQLQLAQGLLVPRLLPQLGAGRHGGLLVVLVERVLVGMLAAVG
jgi:hypothetical protein